MAEYDTVQPINTCKSGGKVKMHPSVGLFCVGCCLNEGKRLLETPTSLLRLAVGNFFKQMEIAKPCIVLHLCGAPLTLGGLPVSREPDQSLA